MHPASASRWRGAWERLPYLAFAAAVTTGATIAWILALAGVADEAAGILIRWHAVLSMASAMVLLPAGVLAWPLWDDSDDVDDDENDDNDDNDDNVISPIRKRGGSNVAATAAAESSVDDDVTILEGGNPVARERRWRRKRRHRMLAHVALVVSAFVTMAVGTALAAAAAPSEAASKQPMTAHLHHPNPLHSAHAWSGAAALLIMGALVAVNLFSSTCHRLCCCCCSSCFSSVSCIAFARAMCCVGVRRALGFASVFFACLAAVLGFGQLQAALVIGVHPDAGAGASPLATATAAVGAWAAYRIAARSRPRYYRHHDASERAGEDEEGEEEVATGDDDDDVNHKSPARKVHVVRRYADSNSNGAFAPVDVCAGDAPKGVPELIDVVTETREISSSSSNST